MKLKLVDWEAYTSAVDRRITASTMNAELVPTIAYCLKQSTCSATQHCNEPTDDEDFERPCVIRRRAESNALHTKNIEDLRTCQRAQRHTRRYLTKLNPKRWRDFCGTLEFHHGHCNHCKACHISLESVRKRKCLKQRLIRQLWNICKKNMQPQRTFSSLSTEVEAHAASEPHRPSFATLSGCLTRLATVRTFLCS